MTIINKMKQIIKGKQENIINKIYYSKYVKYSFVNGKCIDAKQYEGSIIRLYHTIEKGLAYENYRAGFGRNNIEMLINSMNQYSRKYDTNCTFYKTALSVLFAYVKKNKEYGLVDEDIKKRIEELPGVENADGGTLIINQPDLQIIQKMNFEELVKNRHSIRNFANEPVEMDKIKKALNIAQYTASACNRQGWNSYIVTNKNKIFKILENQNGNRGFGDQIDKLLIITFDLRYSNSDREVYQGFIDGGMYAANILNALYYEGIGSIPLSASLIPEQENNIRPIIGMDDAEIFILFVGLGNYPTQTLTTKSARHEPRYSVVS